MKTRPLDPVTPIVSDEELAEWLNGVDPSDPLLPVMCSAATDAIIEYLQLEIVNRAREVVYTDWPEVGTQTRGLSPTNNYHDADIILPYAGLQAVTRVEIYGQEITEYQIKAATPSQIRFNIGTITGATGQDAIRIEYIAGVGELCDIPKGIQVAALNLAAFMYDTRGGCHADDALSQSGAKMMLKPYRSNLVTI